MIITSLPLCAPLFYMMIEIQADEVLDVRDDGVTDGSSRKMIETA